MTDRLVNLGIQFNKNIIKILKAYDLKIDHLGSALFILFALDEKRYDLLDDFDDGNRERRAVILYKELERRGLLESTKEDEKYNYKLSVKAEEAVELMRKEFSNALQADVTADVLEEIVKIEEIEDWINEYIDIFPKRFRDHYKTVAERMDDFIKTYKYDKDVILKATKAYIKEQDNSDNGHTYTRKSIYFIYKGISKDRISDLATWCDKIKDSKEENSLDTSMMDIA